MNRKGFIRSILGLGVVSVMPSDKILDVCDSISPPTPFQKHPPKVSGSVQFKEVEVMVYSSAFSEMYKRPLPNSIKAKMYNNELLEFYENCGDVPIYAGMFIWINDGNMARVLECKQRHCVIALVNSIVKRND